MNKEQEAEAALPPGVARGRSLNTPSEALQERAGGVGPGGQIGPDPNTLAAAFIAHAHSTALSTASWIVDHPVAHEL